MISAMSETCLEKVTSIKHNDTRLSAKEEAEFRNCFAKYFQGT